jgi:hypothetical protein
MLVVCENFVGPAKSRAAALYSQQPMPLAVEKINETTFKITVASRTTTTHTVMVTPDYWQKLTGGKAPPEKLVEKSFEFLLDREPNTSILRTFDLPVIQRYFPEYERTIRTMLE